LLVFVT